VSSTSPDARERAKADKLIAALTRIRVLSESDRQVADDAVELLTALREEVERLSEQVRWLAGKPYRPSRDKVAPGQLALELIEMLTGISGKDTAGDGDTDDDGDNAEPEPEPDADKTRKKRKRRGRELPRQLVENRLDESERCCPGCNATKAEIGFEKQERFVYEPAKVYILEERCYKYACRDGCGGVEQTEPTASPKPIPGSMASASLLAHLVVSKLLDGLPIERIAKRLRRHGVDLATSTLNDWMGRAAQMFVFLHTLLHKQLLECSLVSLDDTPMPARSRGHPKGILRGRQWIYLGDLDRVAYAEFTPDWKGVHPRRVLDGFVGDIQNDGYAGINPLFVGEGAPRRVGCNDHARRRFVQALEQRDLRAQPVIDLYRALYRVEAEAKAAGADAAGTLALRRAASVPLWNRLTETMGKLSTCVANKSPLGKAIIYWQRQQPHLRAFLDHGHLPISNAHVERQIRTVALFRKNSLFFGSLDAGERHAVLLTILLNCVLAGVNPYEYLVDVIDKIAADWPTARAAELLPRNWLEARQREHELNGHSAAATL
jgi:transposase